MLHAGLAAAQKQVNAAQAQVVEAQANAKKLNLDVERYQQLLGKREISQQQFDSATAAATGANATVEARQASLLAAQAQVQQAQSRITQANAEIRNAQIYAQAGGCNPGQGQVGQRPGRTLPSPRSIRHN